MGRPSGTAERGRPLRGTKFICLTGAPVRIQIVCVRIIKQAFLAAMGRRHPVAERHLEVWRKTVRLANWRNLLEVRQTYPDTDSVEVKSGRRVLVFNLRRNEFRLVAAAHYNRQIVYVLRFMTHAEYSKDRWKETL